MNHRPCNLAVLVFCTLAGWVTWPAAMYAAKPVDDLTGPWILFVDDHAVAQKTRVVRKYHAFEKHEENPILVPDRPWEKGVITVSTVLPTTDGTSYRMWYSCSTDKKDVRYNCYAISKDGIKWEKPDLGLVTWTGDRSKDNNILQHSGSSVLHTPWTNDPARQYQSVTGGPYFASASPDGLHWQRLSDRPVVRGGDTGHFRWDPHTQKFRGLVKLKNGSDVSALRRRSFGFTESTDLTSFPPLRLAMAPDSFDDRFAKLGSVQRAHFYGCPFFSYETMYIGLPWVFQATDEEEGNFNGPIITQLATSHDGFHWLREEGDRPPVLDLGKLADSWDKGMVFGMSLIRAVEELRLYYTGYDSPHVKPFHSGIGLATLRKDGFASLDAGNAPGEVLTRRLTHTRGPLHVNFRTQGGTLRVEVLDAADKVLPNFTREDCDPMGADSVDQVVTWHGKPTWPDGVDPIRLRFVMHNASIYSFMAGAGVTVLDEPVGPQLESLYTFEGEGPAELTDKLWADNLQELRVLGTAEINRDESHAFKGKHSIKLGSPWHPLHRLQIGGTSSLGTRFTLALAVRSEDNKPARLFSAYNGNRPVNTSELVFDCDPRGRAINGLRLICKGIPVESRPIKFDDGKYHHLAVTYDDGQVNFYLDGKDAGEAWLPGGAPVTLCRNLLVGEDLELGSDEQFRGNLDDILILGRALSAGKIAVLNEKGAEAMFAKDGSLVVGSE